MIRHRTTEGPPELSVYVPRAVRLSAGGRAALAAALLLGAAGVVVPALMWADRGRKAELRQRLEREGVVADARVTRTGKTGGDHPRRFAEYRYDGGTGRVEAGEDDPLPGPGETITVRYLRAEPWRNWALGDEPYGPPPGAMAAVAAGFSTGAALIAFALRRQWRLLAEGRAAMARVVTVKRNKHSNGATHYRAEYEVALLSGAVRRIWADAGKSTVEGTVTPVVYDPENPKRLSRYPLALVRIDRD